MVIISTRAVEVIIQAVSPESILGGAGAAAAAGAAAGAAAAGAALAGGAELSAGAALAAGADEASFAHAVELEGLDDRDDQFHALAPARSVGALLVGLTPTRRLDFEWTPPSGPWDASGGGAVGHCRPGFRHGFAMDAQGLGRGWEGC